MPGLCRTTATSRAARLPAAAPRPFALCLAAVALAAAPLGACESHRVLPVGKAGDLSDAPSFTTAAAFQAVPRATSTVDPCGEASSVALVFDSPGQVHGVVVDLMAGGMLSLAVDSADDLDTILLVHGPDDGSGDFGEARLAADDDSGPGLRAEVEAVTVPATGRYLIVVATAGGQGRGAATLRVDASQCTVCGDPSRACDDGEACTVDSCDLLAGCQHAPAPCLDDGDPCTVEVCDGVGGCLATALACDDGDPCTLDTCAPGAGCAFPPAECCDAPGKVCDDGDACTEDTCLDGVCAFEPFSCTGGEPCVVDLCDPDTGCVPDPPPLGCDDDNICTADACDPATGTCTHAPVGGEPPCDDGDPCTDSDVCQGSTCVGTPLDGCVVPEPCAPPAGPARLWAFDDPSLVDVKLLDGYTKDAVRWSHVTTPASSPGGALYAGDPACGTYTNGPLDGCAPVPPIVGSTAYAIELRLQDVAVPVGGPAFLQFALRMAAQPAEVVVLGDGTELVADRDYLRLVGTFEVAGQAVSITLWRSTDEDALGPANTTDGAWTTQVVDLSPFAGLVLEFGFVFQADGILDYAPDASSAPWEGVYLDDILLVAGCDPALCTPDGPPCPAAGDACWATTCAPVQGGAYHHCIQTAAQPGVACGACKVGPATCDDSNPCTVDSCDTLSGCSHHYTGVCVCNSDSLCDDGNPLTIDECVLGACRQRYDVGAITAEPELCTEARPADAIEAGFETGDEGFTSIAVSPPIVWHRDTAASSSGQWSMRFAEPIGGTYDHPQGTIPQGLLATPPFRVPPYGTPYLEFRVRLSTQWDVEAPTDPVVFADALRVRVGAASDGPLPAAVAWTSWHLGGSTHGAWLDARVDLRPWQTRPDAAGWPDAVEAPVQAFFDFDAVDAVANVFEGAFIDDVRLATTCLPQSVVECVSGDACFVNPAEAPCLEGRCGEAFQCVYETLDTPECCEPTTLEGAGDDFEGGALGWTFEPCTPSGGVAGSVDAVWSVATQVALPPGLGVPNGGHVLYFGNGDDFGPASCGVATSPPIALPPGAGTTLGFLGFVDVEKAAACGPDFDDVRDRIQLEVIDAGGLGGGPATGVWDKVADVPCDRYGKWTPYEVDLTPWAGQFVRLRWTFDTFDGQANGGRGLALDELHFVQGCPPVPEVPAE